MGHGGLSGTLREHTISCGSESGHQQHVYSCTTALLWIPLEETPPRFVGIHIARVEQLGCDVAHRRLRNLSLILPHNVDYLRNFWIMAAAQPNERLHVRLVLLAHVPYPAVRVRQLLSSLYDALYVALIRRRVPHEHVETAVDLRLDGGGGVFQRGGPDVSDRLDLPKKKQVIHMLAA